MLYSYMSKIVRKFCLNPRSLYVINYSYFAHQKTSQPDGHGFDDGRFARVDGTAYVDGLVVGEGHEHGILSSEGNIIQELFSEL